MTPRSLDSPLLSLSNSVILPIFSRREGNLTCPSLCLASAVQNTHQVTVGVLEDSQNSPAWRPKCLISYTISTSADSASVSVVGPLDRTPFLAVLHVR